MGKVMRTIEQGQPRSGDDRSSDALKPEANKKASLVINAKIALAGAAIAMPFALLMLGAGNYLPFVISIVALGIGFASFSALKSANVDMAARVQVGGISAIGIMMTLVDPVLVDFGFATALLAPVLAAILGARSLEKAAWVMAVLAVVLAVTLGQGYAAQMIAGSAKAGLASAIVYACAAFVVALSARRLSNVTRNMDKAQIDTFRQLIENLDNVVLRYSSQGELLFISNSAENLLGCPRYELAGSGVTDRVQIQDRPAFLTALAATQSTGASRRIEVRMRKDDPDQVGQIAPSYIWIEVSFSAVTGAPQKDGRFEAIAMLADISRRKAQQEEMAAAMRLAEEASEAKSHFLATVGHELRTPLNAIVGFSEMMSTEINGKLEPGQREYVDIIHKSGHHLLDIVNMLLDMSKLEAGHFQLQLESFAPNDLIAPCVQIVEQQAGERNIRLVVERDRELPSITADERALRQILINLLSNAVKFSNPGDEVQVRLRRQGSNLKLSVSDHGIGMSTQVCERIGEPFFQAHQGLARKYEGTGLGLSIVKGLVELHQGRIQIASAPGQGTTMTVLLPLAGPEPEVVRSTVTPLPTKHTETFAEKWHERKSVAQ